MLPEGPAAAAALRAFFFRVPEVADDFCAFPIVERLCFLMVRVDNAHRDPALNTGTRGESTRGNGGWGPSFLYK